jgi:hypothetical protein
MADRRAYGERHRSVLGRVDWACWLVVAALMGLTVLGIALQFAVLGIFTTILAVLLVVFDSWINRPKFPRGHHTDQDDDYYEDDYLQQPIPDRRPAPPAPTRARPAAQQSPRPPAQSPRPPAQGGRPPVPRGQQPQGRPAPGADPRARSPRPPQGQPARPPFPPPGRATPPPTQVAPPARVTPPTRVSPPPGREPDQRSRM